MMHPGLPPWLHRLVPSVVASQMKTRVLVVDVVFQGTILAGSGAVDYQHLSRVPHHLCCEQQDLDNASAVNSGERTYIQSGAEVF